MIIDGKKEANVLLEGLAEKVSTFMSKPCLAIVLIGSIAESLIYVRAKINTAKEIGISTRLIELDASTTELNLINVIKSLNADLSIHGIIVQMPFPSHMNKANVIQSISPDKDVDGFHPINSGYLYLNLSKGFVPATPLGCLHLIKLSVHLSNLRAVVIGRSNIVGLPLSLLLLHNNCTVTICHSHTTNLRSITQSADIVVSCIGQPQMLDDSFFSSDATVIDVGITRVNGKIKGDVDFEKVIKKVKYITPVPGGVGPMTIAYLMSNVIKAYEMNLP